MLHLTHRIRWDLGQEEIPQGLKQAWIGGFKRDPRLNPWAT
jgi:hypothetical protein